MGPMDGASEGEYPTVREVVEALERRYPPSTAESWDAVGMVCGDLDAIVRKVVFMMDPVAEAVEAAIAAEADMIVAHHPLFLKGVHGVSSSTFKGRIVHQLIKADCALYTAHTNADTARPGVSDALARVVGLDNLEPLSPAPGERFDKIVTFVPHENVAAVIDALSDAGAGNIGDYSRCAFTSTGEGTFLPGDDANPAIGERGVIENVAETRVEMISPVALRRRVIAALREAHPYEEPAFDVLTMAPMPPTTGIGRVGDLAQEMTLEAFASHVAKVLPFTVQGVRVAGPGDAPIRRVAVCGGSGDSLFDDVRRSGADAYLTADLRHHPASEAREQAGDGPPYLIDVSHYASEWPWLHAGASRLVSDLNARGLDVTADVSALGSDPWTFRIPSSGGFVR